MSAAGLGIFERHGLAVELLEPAAGPANTKRVAEGGADVCLTSVTHYLRALAEHGPLPARFVAMVTQRTPMAAFVVEGRPTAAGRRPERVRDLAGARVAGSVDKSALARELVAHLRARGAEPSEIVDVSYADGMRALAAGEVDAVADFIDLLPRMRRRVPEVRVRGLRLCDDGEEIYGSGVVASVRILADRPGAVRRLIAALRDAWAATRDAPERGLEAFAQRYPDVAPEVVLECWRETERLVFWPDTEPGALDPGRLAATLRHVAAAHGLPLPDPATTYAVLEPVLAGGRSSA